MHTTSLFGGALKRFTDPLLKHRGFKNKRTPSLAYFSDDLTDSEDGIKVKMPGKSNKFDYTNRTNSGAKLGHIIGSALQKEAEKVKKDTEKAAQKARKQSSESSTAYHESTTTTHIIDLKAPNKDLGDAGVCALAEGLEAALSNGTSIASLALEDLNLSGNSITALSLARLAPIIELAKYDLKTLNLSSNKIKVVDDDEAVQWEVFLNAFQGCMKLRRLDLSNNADLGQRAMEILARVHTSEEAITPIPAGGEASTLSLESSHSDSDESDTARKAIETNGGSVKSHQAMANGQMMKRRCGLRSIPYLTLQNIGLNDVGAMWLSYVIEDHHYPNQLINEINATLPDSSIRIYQQDTDFRGLDYQKNSEIAKDGMQLLKRTEMVRRSIVLDDQTTLAGSLLDDVDSVMGDEDKGRRKSSERRLSRASLGNRRASIKSIHTIDGGQHEATELESARKKIKRSLISHDGASSVELWSSALKTLQASRALLFIAPRGRNHILDGLLVTIPETSILPTPIVLPPSPKDRSENARASSLSLDTARVRTLSPTDPNSYAARVMGNAEQALTDVTNTPATPLKLQKHTHRKGAFGEGADLQTVTDKLNVIAVRESDPQRYIKFQQARIAKATAVGRHFRDRRVPCHLPKDVVQHILMFVMSKRELGVMSLGQMDAAFDWGQKRETLIVEREWLKKDGSTQVLMLLDGMGCLAYGQ